MIRKALQIARACEAMGLSASVHCSKRSRSAYVSVRDNDGDAEPINIRLSDHPLPGYYGGSDIDLRSEDMGPLTIEAVIATVARHFGRQIPACWTPEAVEARMARAAKTSFARWRADIERSWTAIRTVLMEDAARGFRGPRPTLADLSARFGVSKKNARKVLAMFGEARRRVRAGMDSQEVAETVLRDGWTKFGLQEICSHKTQ